MPIQSFLLSFILAVMAGVAFADPVETKVVASGPSFQLLRDGKPYFIKGAGGGGSKTLLAQSGANSFRTWGIGKDTKEQLDEAQKLGLTVTVGFWLPHKFNWTNQEGVEKEIAKVKEGVLALKDHPAVLCWALGNEMESEGKDSPELWKAVNRISKMVHEVDPKHPTMSVVAEIGGKKLQYINSYGGGPSVGERYKKAGVGKPYVVTEFGPPGTWEIGRNKFGAVNELTSTEKAKSYKTTYEKGVLGEPENCLGSYAFTWGFKREATATWYGLFLPDGSKLAAVDVLTELWSGKPPAVLCPEVSKITLLTPDQASAAETLKASIEVKDPQGLEVQIKWALVKEMANYDLTGTGAKATEDLSDGIAENGKPEVQIKLPSSPGVYRLFCYVHNAKQAAAVASAPIKIAK